MVIKEVVAGIDIGGTNTAYGLVDSDGYVVAEGNMKTAGYKTPEDYFQQLCNNCSALLADAGSHFQLAGYGIGAPKGNITKGTIEYAANLPWKGVIEAAEIVSQITGLPAVTGNDANAAAAGELFCGGAKGMKNFIVVTLGTGVGSGFVTEGEMLNGHRGFAGELGHTDVVTSLPPRRCTCGRTGCLETYCSVTGMVATARMLLAEEEIASCMREIAPDILTGEQVWQAATRNDLLAVETFNITGAILGRALANAVAITDPEAIFLGGGLARAGELLFNPVRLSMEQHLLDVYRGKVSLLKSSAGNSTNAAIAGAAALLLMQNNNPVKP